MSPAVPIRLRNLRTIPSTDPRPAVQAPPLPSEPERYELLRVLGRGGMGEVRLVHDRKLDRVVAMKTLRRDLPFRRSRADRLLHEALVQARLQHPAIVPVYDVGRGAGGEPYFTMRRVRGRTVSSLLGELQDELPADRRAQLAARLLQAFGTVCLAVAYAHRHGVVHRDLKPDNVMLGEFGEVWVLDWGVALLLGTMPPLADDFAPLGAIDATSEGPLVGTVGYMAPEQIRDCENVDERADVYSLGAILFEILSLEPLHGGATIDEVVTETLAGVQGRVEERLERRGLSPALSEVCQRATADDPANRFGSARELFGALQSNLRAA